MIPIGNTLISYGITDTVSSYLAISSAVDYMACSFDNDNYDVLVRYYK